MLIGIGKITLMTYHNIPAIGSKDACLWLLHSGRESVTRPNSGVRVQEPRRNSRLHANKTISISS